MFTFFSLADLVSSKPCGGGRAEERPPSAKPGLFLQNYANQRVAALNMIMGCVITGMSGAYPTFNSKKCGKHYLAEFTYPFNAHFNVKVKL
jgi:hypothetical protein